MKDFKFKIGNKDYSATVAEQEGGALEVTVNGKTYHVELPEHKPAARPVVHAPRPAAGAAAPVAAPRPAASASQVASPLPGTITKVAVAAGAKVKKGDVLLVMEAMKMANDITAECDGTVKAVLVKEGQSVNQGDILVDFVSDAAPAPAAPAPKAAPAAPAAAPAPKAGASVIESPLPGTVKQVLVKEGQSVKAGETVLTLEAMKMENDIVADAAGTVKRLLVQPGSQVQSGDALVEMA